MQHPKSLFQPLQKPPILLGIWLLLGTLLRLTNLGKKPAWTDEFATVLYSRADDYRAIPLNTIMPLETLLAPLKGYPQQGLGAVAELLIQKNNHPPLYFMGINLWQRLFPLDPSGYISIDAVRLLSVIFGVLAIATIYGVVKLNLQSEKIAQLSAALMAFSPFGVYLSQEARHYTLNICLVTLLLGFSLTLVRHIVQRKAFTYHLIFSILLCCCAGLLVHYFFSLSLMAVAIALLWFIVETKHYPTTKQWLQLSLIPLGLGVLGVIWITQVLPESYGSTMTEWIRLDWTDSLEVISPFFQLLATFTTMIMLLPIEVQFVPLIITFGAIIIVIGIRLIGLWQQGIQRQVLNPNYYPQIFFLNRFILSMWGLFAVLVFGFGIDITRGARYNFVYFPAVLILLATGLAPFWQQDHVSFLKLEKLTLTGLTARAGTKAIAFIVIISFLSGVTVVNNWGYRKYYHPEKIINHLQNHTEPVLMLMPHESTVQIGEMMGIAWENHHRQINTPPLYFAFIPQLSAVSQSEQNQENLLAINTLLATMPMAKMQVWTINFFRDFELNNCHPPTKFWVSGYNSRVFQCTTAHTTSNQSP